MKHSKQANSKPSIVLASSSVYRANLLKNAQFHFSTDSPDIDETPKPDEAPQALASRLAVNKARKVAARWPHHLIIGSDQVAELISPTGNLTLNKPLIKEIAFQQLKACSGQQVIFHTGCTLIDTSSNQEYALHDQYTLTFRTLTDGEITTYLDREKPFDCAGSIKTEGLGSTLIARHDGTDPATLIGLPMIKLIGLLKELGISPLTPSL